MQDLALAKRAKNVEFNLAIGEPVLLQNHLFGMRDVLTPHLIGEDFQYPTLGGHPELVRELQLMNPHKRVVITNGAKQALDAAISFYGNERDFPIVHTEGPCWPSFRTLAHRNNVSFSNESQFEIRNHYYESEIVSILTAPGNPVGGNWEFFEGDRVKIWDAAYASPTYGWHGDAPFSWECKVESAAKLYGLSGFRVGWLITDNEALAEHVENFVELTTSGVSNPAQLAVAEMVRRHRARQLDGTFEQAHAGIEKNFGTLRGVLKHYTDTHAYSGTGMFDWFHVQLRHQAKFEWALKIADVLMLPGTVFLEAERGWWRVSLGNDTDVTARAAQALSEALA